MRLGLSHGALLLRELALGSTALALARGLLLSLITSYHASIVGVGRIRGIVVFHPLDICCLVV